MRQTTERILTANTVPDPKFQMRRLKNAKVTVLGHRLDVIKMAPLDKDMVNPELTTLTRMLYV